MKKFTLLFLSLLMVSVLVVAQIKFVVYKSDGSEIVLLANEVDSIGFEGTNIEPDDTDKPVYPDDEELQIPEVEKPGRGYTTIVLYIPESECEDAVPYIIGEFPPYEYWGNLEENRMEYLGNNWWKVTVDALTPKNTTDFKFRMDDGEDGWMYQPKNSYELLEDADNYLQIKADETNNLVAIANCDNKVLYIKSGEWSSTPCIGFVPAGRAKFVFIPTGQVPAGKDIVFVGSFEDSPWDYSSDRIMTKQSDGTYVWIGDYPKNFSFKVVLRDCEDLGITDGSGTILSVLWMDGDNKVVEAEAGSIIRFEGCFAGLCPGDGWEDEDTEVVISTPSGYHNSYGYVDLGLPSGTKWATMNVGADSPEDYGDYFAWGETEPKTTYTLDNYKWYDYNEEIFTKYCTSSNYGNVDNKTVLDLADDAAHANWGGDWRMPTWEEYKELYNECTWTWVTYNGEGGYKVTSNRNGNSIFLPKTHLLDNGYYWTSSLEIDSNLAYEDWIYPIGGGLRQTARYCGNSVRPVSRLGTIYSIEFASNGGNGTMQSVDVQRNVAFTIPENTFTRSGYSFVGWNTKADGTGNSYTDKQNITPTGKLTLYAQWEENKTLHNGYEYVDLGLPSGTLWATMNVGADSPEDYGDHFAWGETQPKSTYTLQNYKWYDSATETFTKYPKAKRNVVLAEPEKRSMGITFNVTVPYGTHVCYIAGSPNWEHIKMQKVDDTHFTLTTDELDGWEYKYCAGDDWAYVEMHADGTDLANREYAENDIVEAWYAIQDPSVISTAPIYLRGSMGGEDWPALEEFALQTTDGENYVLEFTEPTELTGEFKIADASWGSMNYGGNEVGVVVNANEAVVLSRGGSSKGLYFADGLVATRIEFTKSTRTLIIIFDPEIIILELEDDAANSNWGGDWRMPTSAEQDELRTECIWTWGQKNGINGYTITGPNGKSIFIPASGNCGNIYWYDGGSYGYYWSSSLYSLAMNSAYYLNFSSGRVDQSGYMRFFGQSVRPVLSK